MASATGTTFRATNKEPEKCYNYANGGLHHDLINRTYGQCTEVLQSSQFSTRDWFSDNGFVNTLEKCNGGHHNLVLRPDDVWATIMTQFSFYINKHAEEFRTKFVKFEGKKELRLGALAASIRSAPYDLLVKAMSEQIHENLVDPEVKKWILPSFSTTTDNDLVTVGVIFMATMKRYFSYAFDISMCGIPWITLEGTIDDWKDVYSRLDKLKEYKLEKWYNMLKPILREFVNAKKGKVNKSFWQRVCHHDSDGFMSGATEYLSGWITAFCVFDEDGNWNESSKTLGVALRGALKWPRISTRSIPRGMVEVDVKINDVDSGIEYDGIMFAGHLAAECKEDQCTMQPTLGWTIALKAPPN